MNNTFAYTLVILQAILGVGFMMGAVAAGSRLAFGHWPPIPVTIFFVVAPFLLPAGRLSESLRTEQSPAGFEKGARETYARWQRATIVGRVGILLFSRQVVGATFGVTGGMSILAHFASRKIGA